MIELQTSMILITFGIVLVWATFLINPLNWQRIDTRISRDKEDIKQLNLQEVPYLEQSPVEHVKLFDGSKRMFVMSGNYRGNNTKKVFDNERVSIAGQLGSKNLDKLPTRNLLAAVSGTIEPSHVSMVLPKSEVAISSSIYIPTLNKSISFSLPRRGNFRKYPGIGRASMISSKK